MAYVSRHAEIIYKTGDRGFTHWFTYLLSGWGLVRAVPSEVPYGPTEEAGDAIPFRVVPELALVAAWAGVWAGVVGRGRGCPWGGRGGGRRLGGRGPLGDEAWATPGRGVMGPQAVGLPPGRAGGGWGGRGILPLLPTGVGPEVGQLVFHFLGRALTFGG